MSWARFSTPGSDVYVFHDVDGYIRCCGCWLEPTETRFTEAAPLRAHLKAHEAEGHGVPQAVWLEFAEFEKDPAAYLRGE